MKIVNIQNIQYNYVSNDVFFVCNNCKVDLTTVYYTLLDCYLL